MNIYTLHPPIFGPVVQRIEQLPSKQWIQVRFLAGLLTMKPIHKFNGGLGATLCNSCSVIISTSLTEDLYCEKCKQKNLLIEIMEADEKDGLYKTNNMAQQTALNWFLDQLPERIQIALINTSMDVIKKAKEMEKEQIVKAAIYDPFLGDLPRKEGEHYYNETYGNKS